MTDFIVLMKAYGNLMGLRLNLIVKLSFSLIVFVTFSSKANFEPQLLNNQTLYASGYISMGARTTVGGDIQSATAITLAADVLVIGDVEAGTAATLGAAAKVDGYIQAGTTVTLAASTSVDGYIEAGTTVTLGADVNVKKELIANTTITIGAGSDVVGDVLAGTTFTVGAGSRLHGNVDAGATTTVGAGVQINGLLTANSLQVAPPVPLVQNQEDLITSYQQNLKLLGIGTDLVSTTFGVNDEVLGAGIYSSIDYLSITLGKTLTLDGKGVDATWVFNIANYLSFAAGSKVVLKDVTMNSRIVWNVLGDKIGSSGYTQLGAGAEVRGYIFSKGFVQAGASTRVSGIHDDCGGVYSATGYVEFGADSAIGEAGCSTSISAKVPVTASFMLLGLGLIFFGLKKFLP
jgi:predicted acyltransferase (DUF342 family)